jgi:predicted metal-dependent hydrolase
MNEPQEDFFLTPEEAAQACRTSLSEQVREGLVLFNHGEYFEAHEVLEFAWRAEREPVRELYRGILQVGVAYYHIQRGNYRGAVKMLARADRWLQPFPSLCCGIDLDQLRANYRKVRAALVRLGPQGIGQFNTQLFQPIQYEEEQTL